MTQTVPTWTRGERMAKAREEAGLSQLDMAAQLGVSDKTVSSWETETRQPRGMMNILARWSEITNVPLWWLLDLGEHATSWIAEQADHDTSSTPSPYALAS